MTESNEGESSTPKPAQVPVYEPRPSLRYASVVGLQAAGVGVFVSAIQNAVGEHTRGAAGFFTRTGGTIGFFGTVSSGMHPHTFHTRYSRWCVVPQLQWERRSL